MRYFVRFKGFDVGPFRSVEDVQWYWMVVAGKRGEIVSE